MNGNEYKVTLTAARINVGLTQSEASALIGISKATLAKYETGKTSPTVPTLKKMCMLYRVPIDAITFTRVAN